MGLLGGVTIHNLPGDTTLDIDDSGNSQPAAFAVGPGVVNANAGFGGAQNTINFDPGALAALTIEGGSGGNTFTVDCTPAGAATTITGGNGNDIFNVGQADEYLVSQTGKRTLAFPGSPLVDINKLVLHVGTGSVLSVSDGDNFASAVPSSPGDPALAVFPATYQISSSQIIHQEPVLFLNGFQTLTATIAYDKMNAVMINGSNTPNVFNVQSTGAPLTINAGSGGDAVNAGAPFNQLAGVGNLTVIGSTGTVLTLDDQANANQSSPTLSIRTNPTYVITNNSVTRNVFETITAGTVVLHKSMSGTIFYDNLSNVTINGGSSPNVFDVQSTATGTPVMINAGAQAATQSMSATRTIGWMACWAC